MNWPNAADLTYNVNINYNLDYLFGGTIALASRIAANTASKNASNVVFDNTRAQLNALAALKAAQAAAGKRKKRLVALSISKFYSVREKICFSGIDCSTSWCSETWQ